MTLPLMPKATAIWLIENTALSFDQIADFCGMHALEIQGIADGEVSSSIQGLNPTQNGQLTKAEIERCEADPLANLKMQDSNRKHLVTKQKGARYTPVARRQDKPDAIAWLIKHHPELSDAQLIKLIGTTRHTIAAIREKSHWNSSNIRPRDPVILGLCSQTELDNTAAKARLSKNPDEA